MNNYPIPVGVPTAYAQSLMFPVGEPNDAYALYFTGRSWLAPVSGEQVSMANETFEPGCITQWHIHHATKGGGQMLICEGGRGGFCRLDKLGPRWGDAANLVGLELV